MPDFYEVAPDATRDRRQIAGLHWALRCFGDIALSPEERAKRLLEEAIEVFQAVGIPEREAARLVRRVYDRPLGISADREELRELNRVLALPESHFTKRQQEKADAGVGAAPAVRMSDVLDIARAGFTG
jgi:hypothetical protein